MVIRNPDNLRIVLGTAQFGMEYGIANRSGKPNFKTAESIVKIAWKGGIREFDTAQGYGESEVVLGRVLSSLGINREARIISKFYPEIDHVDRTAMQNALEKTLSTLKISKLYGLMLHRQEYLDLWDKGLGEILLGFVNSGLVEKVGVSVYLPNRALQALEIDGISVVQLPSNFLDRRFEKAGIFRKAEQKGKQVYVRSVFLQGILLQSSENIPKHMDFALPTLQKLNLFLKKTGLSNLELALGYAKSVYPKAKIIFGTETPEQVQNNLTSWARTLPRKILEGVKETFQDVDEMIVNPLLWPN